MAERFEALPDENLASWLQPDVTAAFETRSGTLANGPERRLMTAVLEDAVHRYRKTVAAKTAMEKAIFSEEEEWIFGRGEDSPFSFETICDALGIDADYLRRGLRRLQEKTRGEQRPRTALEAAQNYARVAKGGFRPSMVPLLLAENLPTPARRALLDRRMVDAATALMQAYGLSCEEAALLVDANPCTENHARV